MPRIYFPAIMETDGGAYGVYFPDLPGCVSAGDSASEAAANAADALALHLEGLVRDGQPIPEASDLAVVQPDPPNADAVTLLVGAAEPTISERVNVWLPRLLLERIDAQVMLMGSGGTRSGFIAEAARKALPSVAKGRTSDDVLPITTAQRLAQMAPQVLAAAHKMAARFEKDASRRPADSAAVRDKLLGSIVDNALRSAFPDASELQLMETALRRIAEAGWPEPGAEEKAVGGKTFRAAASKSR